MSMTGPWQVLGAQRKGGGAPLCGAMLYFGSRHMVPSAMRVDSGGVSGHGTHSEAYAPHVSRVSL